MGILSDPEPRYRLAFPGTPPELLSPSSSTYSSRPSEAAPPSPPMSNYDRSATTGMMPGRILEEPKPRGESSAQGAGSGAASRRQQPQQQQQQPPPPPQQQQQLPSFSSIFSTLPPAERALNSPLSENNHHSYSAATSPLDRPHVTSAPVQPERSFSSSSYFPSSTSGPSSSTHQPRGPAPHEPRLEERTPFHGLSRAPFPGPLSPHPRETEKHPGGGGSSSSRPDSRSGYGPSSDSRGDPRVVDPRGDTRGALWPGPPLGSMSSSMSSRDHRDASHPQQPIFRSHHDRYPPPPPLNLNLMGARSHDQDPYRGDPRQQQQQQQQLEHHPSPHQHPYQHQQGHVPPPPPTPLSTVSEGIPTKDGLGPKIWTGTHFLPRFVRAAEVPGEGMCYFYDDGSHCKTVIDGEAVNAHWGVTKAGKPRKRLAIACITCREKKIKCDPDYPRCIQCEKFSRVCKFKNAPRGGHNATSPSTPPAETDDSIRRMGGGGGFGMPTGEPTRPGSNSSASVSPRTVLRPASPDMLNFPPSKRLKTINFDHRHRPYHPQQDRQQHHHHHQSHPPPSHHHHQQQHHHLPHPHAPPPAPPPPPHHHQSYSHHEAGRGGLGLAGPGPGPGPGVMGGPQGQRSPLPLPPPMHSPLPVLPDPTTGGILGPGGKAGGGAGVAWRQQPELPRIHHDEALRRAWQIDPYVHEPQSVSTILAHFFVHLDYTTLRFLNEAAVTAWMQQTPPPPAPVGRHQQPFPLQQTAVDSTGGSCGGSGCSDVGTGHPTQPMPSAAGSVATQAHTTMKSPEDLMLAYSILAAGASLSRTGATGSQGRPRAASEYAQVARFAADQLASTRPPTLQLVQSRLLLALHFLSASRPLDASSSLSAAISTALSMRLNAELTRLPADDPQQVPPYPMGMTRPGYEECRRRTLWSCFMLERLAGALPAPRPFLIQPRDVLLRLPADTRSFAEQRGSRAPLFDAAYLSSREGAGGRALWGYRREGGRGGKDTSEGEDGSGSSSASVGPMAFLVEAVALYGDVATAVRRATCRGTAWAGAGPWGQEEEEEEEEEEALCFAACRSRLERQLGCLPPEWRFSTDTVARVPPQDQAAVMALSVVHRLAALTMHRYGAPGGRSHDPEEWGAVSSSCARTAVAHADALLEVVCTLVRDCPSPEHLLASVPPFFLTPHAVISAVDVASSSGSAAGLDDLVERLMTARSVLGLLEEEEEEEQQQTEADGEGRTHTPHAAAATVAAVDARIDRLVRIRDARSEAEALAGNLGPDSAGVRVFVEQGPAAVDTPDFGGGGGRRLLWRAEVPLEARFGGWMDCVYPSRGSFAAGAGGSSS